MWRRMLKNFAKFFATKQGLWASPRITFILWQRSTSISLSTFNNRCAAVRLKGAMQWQSQPPARFFTCTHAWREPPAKSAPVPRPRPGGTSLSLAMNAPIHASLRPWVSVMMACTFRGRLPDWHLSSSYYGRFSRRICNCHGAWYTCCQWLLHGRGSCLQDKIH
jgi:hypothetical protein